MSFASLISKVNPLEKNGSASEDQFFLGLVISEKKVKSGIWGVTSGRVRLHATGTTENWGGGNGAEELIVAADASISKAVNRLAQISHQPPNKVVLGLPAGWVSGNAINSEKLSVIQKICQKLLLTPLGFVITPEAVAEYLGQAEGGSSAIVLGVEETEVTVSLVVQGKYLGTQTVGRSDNLALDLEEGLLRFKYMGDLPPRVLITEAENPESVVQTLVAYPWVDPTRRKGLAFLQLPKIDLAPADLEVTAVVDAGGQELTGSNTRPRVASRLPETLAEPAGDKTAGESEPEEQPRPVDFGFVQDRDIAQESSAPSENQPSVVPEPAVVPRPQLTPVPQAKMALSLFSPLGQLASRLVSQFPRLVERRPGKPSKSLAFICLVLLLLAGVSYLILAYFLRTEVRLFVQSQKIAREFEFTVSEGVDQLDAEKMIVPLERVTAEVSGRQTGVVEGRKTVGEKATGEVLIYNGNDQQKTWPKGTIINGPSDLKFVLDQEVVVPGKTTDFDAAPPVDKWGEKKTTVSAADIGPEFNLAANTTLTLESVPATGSHWLVKNPAAFSGGTSREIQAVSREDRQHLQERLISELQDQARVEIEKKIPADSYLLKDLLVLEKKSDHFDHEVGEEAQNLTLEEKAAFSGSFFLKDDFIALTEKVISGLAPADFARKPDLGVPRFELLDGDKKLFRAKIEVEFVPEIDLVAVARRIRGRSFATAEEEIKTIPHVLGMEVVVKPPLFSFLKRYPLRLDNINVSLSTL